MTRLRFAAAIAALIAVSGAAAAVEEWKTVTLRGEAGFTVSIPSAAVDQSDFKDPNDLLVFSVATKLNGGMVCIAQRFNYPEGATQATFGAAIATTRREAFCGNNGAKVSGLSIGGSHSFERDGLQGAVCTASYTDSSEKTPGRVQSQMVIAAASGLYSLTCTVDDEDQDLAEYSWADFWGEKVRHIQESFRLPKSR